jgi:deoxyribonuclease-4
VEGGVLVLENTAGQGSAMGNRIDHLSRIIEYSREPDRLMICIDTCHAFAAGYDIRSEEGWNQLVEEVDRLVGLPKLAGLHLNDSQFGLGKNKDRHHSIGKGELGNETFRHIMRDERMDGRPMVLETIDPSIWPEEIALLRSMAAGA